MKNKIKVRVKRPIIGYPGSCMQHNYGEALSHGYLEWDIKSSSDFDVKFCELPNKHPYVTLDWTGDVNQLLEIASTFPHGARFRIRSKDHISQRDISILTSRLRDDHGAIETIFKIEQQIDHDVISAGTLTLVKDDLTSPEVILNLLKNYYHDSNLSESVWTPVFELIKSYLDRVVDDDRIRNTKWLLKQLKFDNMFSYGENNEINFANMRGITGIFGANRCGKSSIVGTLMYVLFNSTDRGPIKNIDD